MDLQHYLADIVFQMVHSIIWVVIQHGGLELKVLLLIKPITECYHPQQAAFPKMNMQKTEDFHYVV